MAGSDRDNALWADLLKCKQCYHVHNPLPQMQAGVPDKKECALKLSHRYDQEMKIRLRIKNWEGCGSK
jgi:hypothetical protein